MAPRGEALPAGAHDIFRGFWMGGYEGADHLNRHGRPLDMAGETGHLARLDEDHAAARAAGLSCVRESIGWRLAEPAPGRYDFRRAQAIAASARRHGLQVLWTFMHYGTPPDVSLLDEALVGRFAAFAAAAAAALRPWHADDDEPPVYTLVNEMGFVSWVVSSSDLFHPYRPREPGVGSDVSGYEVKRRLARAVLAGMAAVRAVDPRARFLHVEPVIHTVPPPGRDDLAPLARQVASYQWQAWDMLAGRLAPELGGDPAALDLIGVNHYHSSQWEVHTERRLRWHEMDPRRRPPAELLADTWQRYGRPLILAETSHFGIGRARWLNDLAGQARRARQLGVPLHGLCLYPLVDRFDWDDRAHWHHSGLWDVEPPGPGDGDDLPRRLCTPYAQALARWQRHLPVPPPASRTASGTTADPASAPAVGASPGPPPDCTGVPMPHLIVLSHLRWDFVFQRPQQLMSRLADRYPVLFVEEPVRADGPARLVGRSEGPQLEVLVPHTPVDAPGFHDDQIPLLAPLLADHLRARGITDTIVWLYTPMALPLVAPLQPRRVVYDCMDELSAFRYAPRQLQQREAALLKIATLVFTGGPSLYEAKRALHPRVHCLPSAVDATHFAPGLRDTVSPEAHLARQLQQDIPAPRLGYFGVIDERMDLALIDTLAEARPDWQVVMVGPVVKIDPAMLPRRANLHWLGMQPYERLPHLLAGWDLCLLPFALNEHTRFISPTKTLEYMAGEKPVVSTAVADVVALYGDTVRVAVDATQFVQACAELLEEPPAQRAERLHRMAATVFRASWDSTARCIHTLLEQLLAEQAPAPAAPRALAGPAGERAVPPAPAQVREVPRFARASRHVRHLVIGAGPTGLAAALTLGEQAGARRGDTLLVEREDRVGGWCRSLVQDGFTFDHAGHIMFSDDPHVLSLYQRLLGDNLHWQHREAWIWSHGVYTRYPFQGALHGLPPPVLKECLVGAIEARFGPLKPAAGDGHRQGMPPDPSAPPANFEQLIHRVWGAGIARHFAIPYNRKLWAVPLDEMECSWLGGRVPLPDLEQMIDGAVQPAPAPMGPNARFGYPLRGGFQALMDGFLPLLNCDLALKTGVLHVSPGKGMVHLSDGRLVGFDSLISTMPLPRLVQACGDEAPPEVREAAEGLRQVSVRCVNLGVALLPGEQRLTDKHWIYYPEDTVFHRIFVQGNASPHCNAPGGFALTCEISHAPGKPLPCEGQALIERVIADCRRVGLFGPRHRVLSAGQVDMPCAYVVYDHGRAQRVACIRQWMAGYQVVLAGRYSEWAYYNSDHAFVAGRRAALQVQDHLGAGGALARAARA